MRSFRRRASGLYTPDDLPPSPARRALVAGGAAAAGSALASAFLPAAHADDPLDSSSRPWTNLAGFIGVCCKSYNSPPWNRKDDLLDAMRQAKITWMRSGFDAGFIDDVRHYGGGGVRVQAICGDPMSAKTPDQMIAELAPAAQYLVAVEGGNEWNLKDRPDWVNEIVSHQTALYRATKSNAATRAVPVVAPSMGMLKDWDVYGFRPEISNFGNTHAYIGGHMPEEKAGKAINGPALMCGYEPVVVTETGTHDDMSWTGSHYPTPNDVSAVYFPRIIANYFRLGAQRVSFYSIADAGTAPGRENHFGMLDFNLRPKAQYYAIKNLGEFIARGALTGSVNGLGRRITGGTNVHNVGVQGPNGRFLLLVWREADIYNPVTKQRKDPGRQSVRIDFGTARNVAIFNPSKGSGQVGESHGSSLTLTLGAELVCLDISS